MFYVLYCFYCYFSLCCFQAQFRPKPPQPTSAHFSLPTAIRPNRHTRPVRPSSPQLSSKHAASAPHSLARQPLPACDQAHPKAKLPDTAPLTEPPPTALPAASPSPLICPIPSSYTPFALPTSLHPCPFRLSFISHVPLETTIPCPYHFSPPLHAQISLPPCLICQEKNHQTSHFRPQLPCTWRSMRGIIFLRRGKKQQLAFKRAKKQAKRRTGRTR